MLQLITSLLAVLNGRRGQIATISITKVLPRDHKRGTFKSEEIIKHTVANVIVGVNYENKQATREGRANGTKPAENQGLNGMEWEHFPFIKRSKRVDNPKRYLTVYTAKNGSESTYEMNGVELTRDEFVACTTKKGNGEGREFDPTAPWLISVQDINWLKIGGQVYTVNNGQFQAVEDEGEQEQATVTA